MLVLRWWTPISALVLVFVVVDMLRKRGRPVGEGCAERAHSNELDMSYRLTLYQKVRGLVRGEEAAYSRARRSRQNTFR